jgi:serine protease Do
MTRMNNHDKNPRNPRFKRQSMGINVLNLAQAQAGVIDEARRSVVQVLSGGRGIGTGVVWRSNATTSEIVTNAHVVAGAERHGKGGIRVVTSDGRELSATVTATQNQLDLAMLRVDAENLPAASVAESTQLRVGEIVYAIGNPWGNVGVVTAGIVSGAGEIAMQGTDRKANYIRSDVQLAPGNSGGPLLNAEGAVIGINAMIFGGDLSVAIPSHVASEWLAGEPDQPVRLGIGVQTVKQGLLVVDVQPDGAAAQSLLVGDIVVGVAGEPVQDADRFISAVTRSARQRGATRLNVLRGGVQRDVEVAVQA